METSVTSPTGGTVTITESPSGGPPPSGFQILGQDVNISAPAGTPANPLVIKFRLDGTLISGLDINTITVFKNGVAVPNCSGAPGTASPDPCVALRQMVGDDLEITVLSSTASLWQFGIAVATPTPPAGGACDALAGATPNAGVRILGGPKVQVVLGTDGPDLIVVGAGSQIVLGRGGNDCIRTGSDDDAVVAGDGHDEVSLGSGNDLAVGGDGNDRLNGEQGNDKLIGNDGNDTLNGGPNSDFCNGGTGTDTAANCESVIGIP